MKRQIYKLLIPFCLLYTFVSMAQDCPPERKPEVKKYQRKSSLDALADRLGYTFNQALDLLDSELSQLNTEWDRELDRRHKGGNRRSVSGMRYLLEVDSLEDRKRGLEDIEKTKKFSKTFKVSSTDKLEIENKFGKVHVNTWEKNEFAVEVVIIARASTEEKAQRILDRINVEVNEAADLISFKTRMEPITGTGKKSFEINYTVSMPRNNPLRVKNSFGDTYVQALLGRAELESSYGSLKTDKLGHEDNYVKVAFGNGDLGYCKGGRLDVSYSNFHLAGGERIDLSSGFSNVEVGSVGDMVLRNKYGEIDIESVRSIRGDASFGDFRISKLLQSIDMKVKHCGDFDVKYVAPGFRQITLDGSFSSFDINFEGGVSYSFDVSVHFGDARLDRSASQFSLVEKRDNSASYKGRYGKGNGNGNVVIKSSYGDVRLRETSKD
jgi:hypothetical protein